jgi:hypothetical protein|nr:MAG TPA: hypothetical protein [Caudoviricetes sp.]
MTPLNSEASAAAMTDAATIIIKELQTIAASLEDLTKRVEALESGGTPTREVTFEQMRAAVLELQELAGEQAKSLVQTVLSTRGFSRVSEVPVADRADILSKLEREIANRKNSADA